MVRWFFVSAKKLKENWVKSKFYRKTNPIRIRMISSHQSEWKCSKCRTTETDFRFEETFKKDDDWTADRWTRARGYLHSDCSQWCCWLSRQERKRKWMKMVMMMGRVRMSASFNCVCVCVYISQNDHHSWSKATCGGRYRKRTLHSEQLVAVWNSYEM